MAKLTDIQIRAWIKAGERFEGRSDGNGLYLRYRAGDKVPVWRFRYQFAGKSRVMLIGSYGEMSLAKARETAKELSARVALGFDVAGEKQERKADALEKMEQEKSRERWLTREELIQFFQAMRMAKGFSRENELTMKLILCLCCRKMELCGAPWAEFDLDGGIWHLPAERAKNGDAIDIPLPPLALEWLRELHSFSGNSKWVLPARKMQHRMIPHIQESTLPVRAGFYFG